MNDNAVTLRRSRIMDFVNTSHTISYDNPKIISDELNIDYDTVKNDVKAIRDLVKERLKGYDLTGFLQKTLNKRDRIHQISLNLKELAENTNDERIRIHAHQAELKAIHDEFDLESDGITLIVDELESRDNNVSNEPNKKTIKE